MIDDRDTFASTPYKGFFITLRHGAFAGYVALIHREKQGRIRTKIQAATRDEVLEKVEDWIQERTP